MSTALKKQTPDSRPERQRLMDDHIVRLEVAAETLAAYIGYLNTQILREEDQEKSDPAILNALEAQKNVLLDERESLIDREDLIAKAIYVYGPIMKALYAS